MRASLKPAEVVAMAVKRAIARRPILGLARVLLLPVVVGGECSYHRERLPMSRRPLRHLCGGVPVTPIGIK